MLFDSLAHLQPVPARTIIIGSGAVGLAMAVDLARRGEQVVVLEAGAASLTAESQKLFGEVTSEGRRWKGAYSGRYRLLGGTTNFWGGQIVRIDPLVFDGRPWVPHSEWPISAAEIAPWYDRAEKLVGSRQLPEDAVWKKVGSGAPELGPDLESFLSEWVPEPNFYRLFKSEIERLPNLTVVLNSQAVGFSRADSPGRLVSVTVVDPQGKRTEISGERFVIACGTLEAVRLLLFPLADGQPAVWNRNDWIGRCFMDHIDCFAGKVKIRSKKEFSALFDNIYWGKTKYSSKVKASAGFQAAHRLLNISAYMVFESSHKEHIDNVKLFAKALARGRWPANVADVPGHLIGLARVAVPLASRYLVAHRMYNLQDRGVRLRLTVEQPPTSDSRIFLDSRQDSSGLPRAGINWQFDGTEIESMKAFVDIIDKKMRSEDLAEIEQDELLSKRDARFFDTIDEAFHHMGGARMASSKAGGVVDRNLRLFDTDNLYVAGAAVFPAAGFSNPTLTAIALGLRLSDHLSSGTVL